MRASWGGGVGPVAEKDVAAARASLDPEIDKSPFEKPRLAELLAAPNAGQVVRGMRLNAKTVTLPPYTFGHQAAIEQAIGRSEKLDRGIGSAKCSCC
ncbi:hypothetical protein LNV09_16325 [Paucibacter sp. B2R-40]|uniref:hypothetical protein n=1 Tax=Paucibacter sp. B2R-40 TaxID=2893554 RepID=UPI0021E4CFB0|nr:hypothetical protein [Paucibacter sp. B2R-40]MCV2355712.1 hypothetical protein [Paucibacter sp. B2R-40]